MADFLEIITKNLPGPYLRIDRKDGRGVVPADQRSTNSKGGRGNFFIFWILMNFSHPLLFVTSSLMVGTSDPVQGCLPERCATVPVARVSKGERVGFFLEI